MTKSNLSERKIKKKRLLHFKNVLCLNVSSVEDFKSQLKAQLKSRRRRGFVSIAVSGKDILVCPIHFKNILDKEIDDKIKFLVFNLLNASIDQVVLSYQVSSIEDGQCTGVIACAKKSVIDQYLRVCDDFHFLPYRLIPYSLVSIDSFCQDQKILKGRSCVLHCSENSMIHLCILQDHKCEIFREIVYDDLQKVFRDIEQTLSHAMALSKCKHFDQIFYFGDSHKSEELAEKLKTKFGQNFCHGKLENTLTSLAVDKRVFQINLFQEHSLSFHLRSMLEFSMLVILLVMTFGVSILALRIFQLDTLIIGTQSTYESADVKKAQQLVERINAL
ncbi:MAG: hypothetical protein K8S27_05755 [Candidatus Omnitrophica bacterium]|nr:hypothetical protein [Candidatus Omnitrophota bacterium]